MQFVHIPCRLLTGRRTDPVRYRTFLKLWWSNICKNRKVRRSRECKKIIEQNSSSAYSAVRTGWKVRRRTLLAFCRMVLVLYLHRGTDTLANDLHYFLSMEKRVLEPNN